jgi:hypothetical protein
VEELISENRRFTISDLSAPLLLRFGTVHNIVREEAGYRREHARCVPRRLTEEHKNRRFEVALSHVQRFKKEGNDSWNPK